MLAHEGTKAVLPSDVLLQVLTFASSPDWFKLTQVSSSSYDLCMSSTNYIYNAWKTSAGFSAPSSLHSIAVSRELFKLFIFISECDSYALACDVDERHRSLLDLCVELRLYQFSRWLVSRGYRSCVESETMFLCIRRHDLEGASILMSCGVHINRFRSRDDGMDVLTCSVVHGSVELVKLFLSNGVSIPSSILVDAIQARGSDPLVVDIVETLIDLGNCDVNVVSIGGIPLVQVAILSSIYSLQLLELLFKHGADMNKRDLSEGGGLTALDIADRKRRRRSCLFLETCGRGRHSLRYGVETGNIGLIASFMQNDDAVPDLHYLVCLSSAMGQYSSLRTLLDLGHIKDINEIQYRSSMTPLHLAACRGHRTICRLLLNAGANPTAKVHGGIDLHIQAAVLSGSPIWYNPADEGPNGTLLPPPVRLKSAAELARESGYAKVGKMIDLFVIESEVIRRESEGCVSDSDSVVSRAVQYRV